MEVQHAGFDTRDILVIALAILALIGTSKLTPLLVGIACPWEALRQRREEFKRRLEEEMRARKRDALKEAEAQQRRQRLWATGAVLVVVLTALLVWIMFQGGDFPRGGPFLIGRH